MTIDFTKLTVLFGGSFDPVHEGHLHVARAAREALPKAQIVFVPANISPGKAASLASPELRLEWLRSVAQPDGFLVWDTEIRRGGPSYTIDTLKAAHELGASREKLFLLMGGDAYASLSRWKQPEEIRALSRIAVVNRPGQEVNLTAPDDIFLSPAHHPASSTAIRAGLAANPPLADWLPESVKSSLDALILLNKNPYARKNKE